MANVYVKEVFKAGLSTDIDASASNDVPRLSQVESLIAGSAYNLDSARVVSYTNIDTATGGLLTIDGVTVADGDRVLLIGQTSSVDNGVYVASSGAWSRATDADTGDVLKVGTRIYVREGTDHNHHEYKLQATADATVGTDALVWVHIFTYDLSADTLSFDPTGNTYATATSAGAAIDQLDAEAVAQDARLDTLETDVAAIDVAAGALTVYDGQKATVTGLTFNGSGAWTTVTHNLNEDLPSAIAIYDLGKNLLTRSFDVEVIDANTIRVLNESAVTLTDMTVVVRA